MTENMKKLIEQASKNADLAKMLENAVKEDIIASTKTVGIELTDADFIQTAELDDDELDSVAGGASCICSFGGGGTASEMKKTVPLLWVVAANIQMVMFAVYALLADREIGKSFSQ